MRYTVVALVSNFLNYFNYRMVDFHKKKNGHLILFFSVKSEMLTSAATALFSADFYRAMHLFYVVLKLLTQQCVRLT